MMRRRSPFFLLLAVLAIAGHLSPGPASAQRAGGSVGAAATERYFGEGAFTAVRGAVADTARSCTISDDGLTALVLAPVFAESSAATTASSAPAPMTLSRYDEWNGTYGTSGRSANYGLYAFRDPETAYQRAFWSPGIGIWQMDSAGLGAPLTTVEAMDVRVVSGEVAAEIARRYCAASGTGAQRRQASWSPWVGCNRRADGSYPCETFFQEMYSTSPRFSNLSLVAGIGPLGGVVKRTCTLGGVSGTVPCWYVSPTVGVIQGSTAWATFSPDGGSGPTVAPTPLPKPFYVVDRGTTEERHWLREDTGYGKAISARRTIGRNARPTTQSGSGLTWGTSALCDLHTGRGACAPLPPGGVTSQQVSVSSGYRPRVLDATGDGIGDILWYRPGSGTDALWVGSSGGGFSSTSVSVSGDYPEVHTADFDGDGDDDVLWYAPSSGTSSLWRSRGDGTFASLTLAPGSGRRPLILNLDADPAAEIFWYGPGSTPDAQWDWSGSGFSVKASPVSGQYAPFVGDFDGNGRDDIFWYSPGTGSDFVWLHRTAGGRASVPRPVSGWYRTLVGDLDGDGRDDVFWYAPGTAGDFVWYGGPSAQFASSSRAVDGTYQPFVAALNAGTRDQIVWYAPGPASDWLWTWSTGRAVTSSALILPSTHTPAVGPLSAGGADGVLWYATGAQPDVIWRRA